MSAVARALRQSVSYLTAKLGSSKDSDVQKVDTLAARSSVVVAALDSYCEKARAFAAASRTLYATIGSFYPPGGPMAPALAELSKNGGGSPWSDDYVGSRNEQMKTNLNSVVAGLGALSHRISLDIATRTSLEQEKEHYSAKVGRLLAEYNSAPPAARDAVKEKLTQNQTKLSAVMSDYADVAEKIDVALRTLDFDMAAMLGPTVTQLIKAQAAAQADTAKFATAALGLAAAAPPLEPHGAARELPEGVVLGGGGGTASGAAPAAPSLPPRKGSSLAAAAAGRTTPTGQPRDDHAAVVPVTATAGGAASAAVAIPAVTAAPPAASVAAAVPAQPSAAAAAHAVAPTPPPVPAAPPAAAPAAPAPAPASAAPPLLPVVMRAEADWAAQSADDLSLLKDALVLVVRRDEESGDGWWVARTSDETGSVPDNFLAALAAPLPAHARKVARFAYAPDDPAEVSFAKGDVLEVLTPVDSAAPAARAVIESGWLLVRCSSGAVGFAPSNYLDPASAV